MAITRAQQAKQMLQDGGRIGLRFGNRGPGQASRESRESRDARDRGMGMGGKQRSAPTRGTGDRNPMAQFSGGANTEGVTFMDQARRDVNPLGILTELPGTIGIVSRALTPNPFGFSRAGRPFDANRFPGGGDSQATADMFIPAYIREGFNTQEEYDEYLASQREDASVDDKIERSLAFRADGGPIGGEFDFESARQMYGLGKLVKKVTKTVKKIAKSPIGKAALLYAGAGGLGNIAAGKGFFGGAMSNIFKPTTFLGNVGSIFSKPGLENIMSKARLGKFVTSYGDQAPVFEKNFLGKVLTSPTGIITATSLAAGLLTPEEEQQAQELAASSTDFDLERARNSILAARREQYMMDERARGFKAEGGRIEYQEGSKEPVAKKTMPLLDMGGKEMDLREEGGFVPIGRMEKADDVPARLSKNEFVFTADAVRNAGDGDVDKGAEVMYNMMKNLEAGGEVSEESQGLEGARKMFQTSQRLGEVV